MTVETIFFYITFLFLLIILIIFFYYLKSYRSKLILVEKEYEKSKNIIKNIVITFNKKQEDQESKIEGVLYNIESLVSRVELLDSTIKDHKKKILTIDDDIKTALLANVKMSQRLLDLDEADRFGVISHRSLDSPPEIEKQKASIYRERINQIPEPVSTNGVLNGLTETEKQILTILVKQGEKTAPEIEKIIDKTREHTSRLMKKLFTAGYVNRNTHKIPYVYEADKDLIEIINVKEEK